MKAKHTVKIIIDIIMTVLFALLVFGEGLGMFFHEVAGIAVFVLFAAHLFLNGKWIKRSFGELAHGSISKKNGIYLALDLIIFFGISAILVTSILISRVVFSSDILSDYTVAETIHNTASYITLGMLAVHIGCHVKYLLASFAKLFKNISLKAVRRTVASAAAIIAVCAIIYTQTYNAYKGRISSQNIAYTEVVTSAETTTQAAETTAANSTTAETTQETTTQKKKDEMTTEKSTTTTTTATTETAMKTLNEYLGGLHCTGCGKHCSLLSPQCGRGQSKVSSATQDYYSTYGTEN